MNKREANKVKRGRRSYSEIFLSALKDLSADGKELISNKALREKLGWDEERYDRVKVELRAEDAVIVGRGYGGSVGLASVPGSNALSVFISYSHVDEKMKSHLLQHLEPLRRLHLIETWHDQKIKPGDEWDATISKEIDKADIILLLISVDFINSKYCYDVELDKAMELHASGKARVIPVILRNCLWQLSRFAKLQALPSAGKAVATWSDQDEALVNVAIGIREVAEELLASK